MAATYQEQSGINGNEMSRKDVEAAIAKAVELRALHAALMQQQQTGNSPSPNFNPHSASPVSRNLPAQDYPVFTPSYDDEPILEYQQTLSENRSRNYADNWADYAFDVGNTEDNMILSEHKTANSSSRKGDDQNSVSGFALRALSPGPDYSKSRRRNSLGDTSSRNKCKPSIISSNNDDFDSLAKSTKKSNIVVPLTDSHSSLHPQPRSKGLGFSWLLPKALKKKNKNENSPIRRDEISRITLNDFGMLKNELIEAREARDIAFDEAAEMKSSVVELSRKLEYLETYCEELKKALRQVNNFPRKERLNNGNEGNSMPVTEEVMVEGFLQIVSEARLSVKQFCKTLVKQIEGNDYILLDNLNSLLQPYKLSLNSKHSKVVSYHLEAFVNESLYQDFENGVFQKNGTPKLLDPRQQRQDRFQLFVSLRNLSWNEVLRKGTKYYSDEFSKFCDQKMSGIIGMLGWSRAWPEQLLQAFFVAAKCIWLLHLLAFSFDPPLGIMRVDENRAFEGRYMEDMFADKQRPPHGPSRVKIMVMPGFYVHDEVIKCKVLCRYRSVV